MLHIDDLIEPRPEQILFFRRLAHHAGHAATAPMRPLTYGESNRFDAMPPFEGAMADRLPKCQP
jgi:hypothetical protein